MLHIDETVTATAVRPPTVHAINACALPFLPFTLYTKTWWYLMQYL